MLVYLCLAVRTITITITLTLTLTITTITITITVTFTITIRRPLWGERRCEIPAFGPKDRTTVLSGLELQL